PSGWLLCNGSTLTQGGSAHIYEALYGVIGTTDGGTGTSTFSLPDLRGRAAIGAGTGVGLSPRTPADEIGEENHQLTINEIPSHTHLLLTNEYRDTNTNIMPGSNDYIAQRGQGGLSVNYGEYDIAKGSGILPGVGKARETGGDAAHNNMQPSLVLNFIIKY
ncbi:MAG: tail fiber protein, partial [Candidatus Omnitrophota bacterium]